MVAYELKNQASITARGGEQEYSIQDRDNLQLQRLGKKPVLKVCDRVGDQSANLITKHSLQRNFGILSILGFSCTILGTWEGLLGYVRFIGLVGVYLTYF